jgi:hypothetical protein
MQKISSGIFAVRDYQRRDTKRKCASRSFIKRLRIQNVQTGSTNYIKDIRLPSRGTRYYSVGKRCVMKG